MHIGHGYFESQATKAMMGKKAAHIFSVTSVAAIIIHTARVYQLQYPG
ncbi:hypothetical protein MASR2M17_06630 [Aminivibrio sp.]